MTEHESLSVLESEVARLRANLAECYRSLREIKGLLIVWHGLDDSKAIQLIDKILAMKDHG